jgi:hypothetical protein
MERRSRNAPQRREMWRYQPIRHAADSRRQRCPNLDTMSCCLSRGEQDKVSAACPERAIRRGAPRVATRGRAANRPISQKLTPTARNSQSRTRGGDRGSCAVADASDTRVRRRPTGRAIALLGGRIESSAGDRTSEELDVRERANRPKVGLAEGLLQGLSRRRLPRACLSAGAELVVARARRSGHYRLPAMIIGSPRTWRPRSFSATAAPITGPTCIRSAASRISS